MTEKEKHRRKFWTDRFTEHLHSESEKSQPDDERKTRNCKRFADACLDQYDITFNEKVEQ